MVISEANASFCSFKTSACITCSDYLFTNFHFFSPFAVISSGSGGQFFYVLIYCTFTARTVRLYAWPRRHIQIPSTAKHSNSSRPTLRHMPGVQDDYVRNWDENQGSSDNVDTTKDPCQKVKCSRHKVCMAQGYQRAVCINRKKLEHRLKQPALRSSDGNCQPCPISSTGPVCGSDGHNYASRCKLEQQACLTGKELTLKCSGLCPCSTAAPAAKQESKRESCTGQDLADLGERLRDWFQLLQSNAKQNNNSKPGAKSTAANIETVLDRSLVASCKDSVGWMFSKLDTNSDLYLDQAELAAINLDKYEICIRPFFNSCDSYKDGKVSTAEWCLCFWREKPPCLAELERIQVLDGGKRKFGRFIPNCDEDGFYRKLQCDRGECWCVDQYGGEVAGSRIRAKPDCDDGPAYSGDFGSGVGWEDEEEKGGEETAEEAEEEEGEAGEADDEGYIW
ncbi:testican-2 isoform X1 [Syngnathoides biaculeatus]|uniref:testican-2 isoform X1 n=2 Tax=Syngnathoides biaculeatus TaxID=300417 RepID=UPI002ADE82B5|nr:testican-2 isoform X1 [Syngnathoides biaculeatus]